VAPRDSAKHLTKPCAQSSKKTASFPHIKRFNIASDRLTLPLSAVWSQSADLVEVAIVTWLQLAVGIAVAWSNDHPDDVCAVVNAACLHAKQGEKEEALEGSEHVFGRAWKAPPGGA
jgi:hypothetical protein